MFGGFHLSGSHPVGKLFLFIYRNSLVCLIVISFLMLLFFKSHEKLNERFVGHIVSVNLPIAKAFSNPLNIFYISVGFFQDLRNLEKDNTRLKFINSQLHNMLLESRIYEYENKELRRLLKYSSKLPLKYITTRILINSHGPYVSHAIVDVGSDHNIAKGSAVISSNGLVGRVVSVSSDNARVMLFDDVNSKIPVYGLQSSEKAILVGRNNFNPYLKYVSKKSKFKDGELIFTSGDGLVYPVDIPIGVLSINDDGRYVVKPFVNLRGLKYVQIVIL
jgi:rod shape-determining protein MreC